MSLLPSIDRVRDYWKEHFPPDEQPTEEALRDMLANAQHMMALMVSQGMDEAGAAEMVYPELFPEPPGNPE